METAERGGPCSARVDLTWIVVVWAAVTLMRIAAPADLATGDQPLQTAAIRDVVFRGHWLVQHSDDGLVASKPPLYTWLAALFVFSAPAEESVPAILYKLPSILAALAALLLTWDLARRIAGEREALYAALLMTTTPLFVKYCYFARTDMLLVALIVMQLWGAVIRRPVVLWSAAALAMLTKGPVGVVLPLAALVLWWWHRGELRQHLAEMRVATGLVVALLPFAIWFGLALGYEGQPVWDQLVRAETADRFSSASSKSKENRHILYYIPHLIARLAPASLLALAGAHRLPRRRRDGAPIMLAVFWVAGMLLVLSLVPSKRADRLFPILPAVCILAGWVAHRVLRWKRIVIATLVAVMLAGNAAYQFQVRPRADEQRLRAIERRSTDSN